MIDKVYDGPCVDGPLKGLLLAHYAKEKDYLKPMRAMFAKDTDEIEVVKIGKYCFDEKLRYWKWEKA
jgi:hypothetical protein